MTLQKKTMMPTAGGVILTRLLLTSPSTVFTWEKHRFFLRSRISGSFRGLEFRV